MNLDYIRYAVEVAKTKSINKAAENLYISQPNLSRTISKLEQDLGFQIFERSVQGIELTVAGRDFLEHATNLLEEYDRIVAINTPDEHVYSFSISVPKASYITSAFTSFVACVTDYNKYTIDFKESNALGAINNMLNKGFNLGIIRYELEHEPLFDTILNDLGMVGRQICTFEYMVVMNKNNPLAQKEEIDIDDLKDFVEITHGDTYLPYGHNHSEVEKNSRNKNIRVYDSMGQLAMVKNIPNSFMVVYPLSEETMEKYNLVQKRVKGISRKACDVIIYRKKYQQSLLDQMFVAELEKSLKEHNK